MAICTHFSRAKYIQRLSNDAQTLRTQLQTNTQTLVTILVVNRNAIHRDRYRRYHLSLALGVQFFFRPSHSIQFDVLPFTRFNYFAVTRFCGWIFAVTRFNFVCHSVRFCSQVGKRHAQHTR